MTDILIGAVVFHVDVALDLITIAKVAYKTADTDEYLLNDPMLGGLYPCKSSDIYPTYLEAAAALEGSHN